jgi:hypothetical protein
MKILAPMPRARFGFAAETEGASPEDRRKLPDAYPIRPYEKPPFSPNAHNPTGTRLAFGAVLVAAVLGLAALGQQVLSGISKVIDQRQHRIDNPMDWDRTQTP